VRRTFDIDVWFLVGLLFECGCRITDHGIGFYDADTNASACSEAGAVFVVEGGDVFCRCTSDGVWECFIDSGDAVVSTSDHSCDGASNDDGCVPVSPIDGSLSRDTSTVQPVDASAHDGPSVPGDGMDVNEDQEAALADSHVDGTNVPAADATTTQSDAAQGRDAQDSSDDVADADAGLDGDATCECLHNVIVWTGPDGRSTLSGCQSFTYFAWSTKASCTQEMGCNASAINATADNPDVQKARSTQAYYLSPEASWPVSSVTIDDLTFQFVSTCPSGLSCEQNVPSGVQGFVFMLVGIQSVEVSSPACDGGTTETGVSD